LKSVQNKPMQASTQGTALAEFLRRNPYARIVSIDLDINVGEDNQERPRVAVLDQDGVHIYKEDRGTLAREYFLPNPFPPWDHIWTFPSRGVLFGVILFASDEYSYGTATVVCYAHSAFREVFEGSAPDFVDFDLDGVPEIVTPKEPASALPGEAERVSVWAWSGEKYVEAIQVVPTELWSSRVAQAVRDAKRKLRETHTK
jgi:hypothetical protein